MKMFPVPKWLNQGTYLEPLGGENARVPRLEVDNATTYIDKDGSNNMTFTDAVTGTKTLAQLGAGAHTQNTDTILTTDGATALINAGKLVADLTTDRWLSSVTNTFLGNGVAGVGGLSHTTGSTGWNNTGIGTNALYSITTGLSNTGIGNSALLSLTTAQHNTGVGVSALYALTTGGVATGGLNSAFGSGSLQACTVGYYNCGFGVDSLFACIGGYNNIGIGVSALAGITSGYQNVAIGGAAGAALTTESGNVFIGTAAGQNATGSNQLYIANSNTATPLILGDFAGLTLTFPNTTILRWNNAAGVAKNILWMDASNYLNLVNNAANDLYLQTGQPANIVCWGGVGGTNRQLILAGTDSATGAGNVSNSALLNVQASYRDASNVQTYWSGKIQHYIDTGGATPASRVVHSINDVDIIRVFNTNGVIGVTIGANPYATQPSGSLGVAGGVMIGANSLNNLIDDASGGTGSTALYIGNAQIATTADIPAAASAAEVTAGTDATKYVAPDALAGSSIFGVKPGVMMVIDPTTDVTIGDGKAYIPIPAALNGMNLIRAQAMVITAGTTNATTVAIYNVTQAADMLSVNISIASGATVGTVGTVDTNNDDVATNDVLRIDVDAVSTTAPKGLLIVLEFQLP